jgi:sodium/hydrogen exchanger 8
VSGIMAILFCGVLMSHYTHFNLSSPTKLATEQIFKTVAFMAETAIFAYMGLSLTTMSHNVS